MAFNATVVADSINPAGQRLTTLEVTYPRIILAEMNTHCRFSRNTASTRAIPLTKQIEAVTSDPYVPERFPENKPGMSNDEWLEGEEELAARSCYKESMLKTVESVKQLAELKVHKQTAGRLLEPFMYVTQVITSAFWGNFFTLRNSPQAQPEIQKIAAMMQDVMSESMPVPLFWGEWHTPYVPYYDTSYSLEKSVARCAATSYTKQNDAASTTKEIDRYDLLRKSGHWSPFQHQALASKGAGKNPAKSGNFFGTDWYQYRKMFAGEAGE